jgi:hypothetical protein
VLFTTYFKQIKKQELTVEYTTLTIELPRLSGEQAAMVQQTLYAFLDAFDTYYCFAIERYHQDALNDESL